MRGESVRFWLPVGILIALACYSGQKLIRAHLDQTIDPPRYTFEREIQARRGSIYACYGKESPLVSTYSSWEYRLDPVALTNRLATGRVHRVDEPSRTREGVIGTIADALGLKYREVLEKANNTRNRYQLLAKTSDPDAHAILSNPQLVAGVAILDRPERNYLRQRSLAHVLGATNSRGKGIWGLEMKLERVLAGTPGVIRGMVDSTRHELYDKRTISIAPQSGSDVYLTIEPNIQYETEMALQWGLGEYGADSGWAIVMDAQTAAIYAMTAYPDFDPSDFPKDPEKDPQMRTMNRAISFVYEPGSVMKVITAATAIERFPERYGPDTLFDTSQNDSRYYRLPGDAGHVWEPTMTLKDAIVHSSNIVIGKLSYDLGPKVLYDSMRSFGFGACVQEDLPYEERGLLPVPGRPNTWDLLSRSRAGIGQYVAVTAIQLIGAYQAIANDGRRMQPYIVDRIVDADGRESYRHEPKELARPIGAQTARTIREMMCGVATRSGTARRAAIRGYSIAGKTGTAQKTYPKGMGHGYEPGKYRATFCGMVPAEEPRFIALVTLDFNRRVQFHQGGNSAAPVFKRIALGAIRYLRIDPDKPDELEGGTQAQQDEFEQILYERSAKYDIIKD